MSTALNQTWMKIKRAFKRRPVRIAEAVVVLAGALGLAIQPDATAAILTLVALTIGGGEVAQTRTKPYDPRTDR